MFWTKCHTVLYILWILHEKTLLLDTKGQKKSKWFFLADVSSKKWTNEFYFTMKPQVDLFLFVFWRKLKTPKRHFEIKWPLRILFLLLSHLVLNRLLQMLHPVRNCWNLRSPHLQLAISRLLCRKLLIVNLVIACSHSLMP